MKLRILSTLGCTLALFAASAPAQDKSDKNAKLLETACGSCHGSDMVTAERHTRPEWESIVDDMVGRGASATPEDIKTLVDYLASAYGKAPDKK